MGACGFREAEGELELLLSLDPGGAGPGPRDRGGRVVLDHTVRVGSVVAFTDADNVPSQRVLARLGMTLYDFDAPPRLAGAGRHAVTRLDHGRAPGASLNGLVRSRCCMRPSPTPRKAAVRSCWSAAKLESARPA